jgi:mono/diheme cytochrome c family protein
MNEVLMNSTRYLNEGDVNAMAVYLKGLPPNEADTRPTAKDNVLGMGRTLYNLHCGTCHLPTGLGDEESAPRLGGGSLVVRASNPASLINVILDGPERPDPPLLTKRRKPMESFRYLLDDEEVAALASYLRSTWGNTGGEVTAKQVAEQR